MKYFVILLILLGFVGTAFAQYVGDISDTGIEKSFPTDRRIGHTQALDVTFELKNREYAKIPTGNLMITFLEVVEDSRCPTDVVCVWQGTASIYVNVRNNEKDFGNHIIPLSATLLVSPQKFDGYFIRLIKLEPYAVSNPKIIPSEYVATMLVGKVNDMSAYSPLKQFKSGIPIDKITCKEELILVTRSSDDFPACIKPESKAKLIHKGWAKDAIPSKINLIDTNPMSGMMSEYEHTDKNNSVAKNIFSKCGQDDDCTIEYMQKISRTSDRQTVLDTLDDLITIYDDADFYCHPNAHHLGEFLLGYVNGNITDTTNYVDSRCASGVLHGITENTITLQTLLHQKDIQDVDIIQPCQIIEEKLGYHAKVECIHGMGHSITKAYQYDVINAVQKCDAYKDKTERYMCQGGLFMENINHYWDNLGGQFDQNDPYYPCDKIDSNHAGLCYRYQGLYFLKNSNFNFTSSFEMCNKTPNNNFIDACYKGVSTHMATIYFDDIKKTADMCLALKQDKQPVCVKGAIESLTRFVSDDLANNFCSNLPEDLKIQCNERRNQLIEDRY